MLISEEPSIKDTCNGLSESTKWIKNWKRRIEKTKKLLKNWNNEEIAKELKQRKKENLYKERKQRTKESLISVDWELIPFTSYAILEVEVSIFLSLSPSSPSLGQEIVTVDHPSPKKLRGQKNFILASPRDVFKSQVFSWLSHANPVMDAWEWWPSHTDLQPPFTVIPYKQDLPEQIPESELLGDKIPESELSGDKIPESELSGDKKKDVPAEWVTVNIQHAEVLFKSIQSIFIQVEDSTEEW